MVEFSREKRTEMLNRLREMMGDEPVPIVQEPNPGEEIPENAPGFLNPKVLAEAEEKAAKEEQSPDIFGEENTANRDASSYASNGNVPELVQKPSEQAPEKMEAVLNSGKNLLFDAVLRDQINDIDALAFLPDTVDPANTLI